MNSFGTLMGRLLNGTALSDFLDSRSTDVGPKLKIDGKGGNDSIVVGEPITSAKGGGGRDTITHVVAEKPSKTKKKTKIDGGKGKDEFLVDDFFTLTQLTLFVLTTKVMEFYLKAKLLYGMALVSMEVFAAFLFNVRETRIDTGKEDDTFDLRGKTHDISTNGGDDYVRIALSGKRDDIDMGAGKNDQFGLIYDGKKAVKAEVGKDFDVMVGKKVAADVKGAESIEANTGSGNDIVMGAGKSDVFRGGIGKDTFMGKGGKDSAELALDGKRDTLDMGKGKDEVRIVREFDDEAAVEIKTTAKGNMTIKLDGKKVATVKSVEKLTYLGSNGDDKVTGTKGKDSLFSGTGGNDTLDGGRGNDEIEAGAVAGSVVMTGGAGADTFVIRTGFADRERTITDFSAEDRIDLGTAFYLETEFGSAPSTFSPTLYYDKATGQLLLDQDGLGTFFEAEVVATLLNGGAPADFSFDQIL